MAEERKPSLTEAVTAYLSTLTQSERQESQQELNKFVRWYGGERPISGMTAREVGEYGEGITASVTDPIKKLEPVKSFLTYAKKKGITSVNLAPYIRISKTKQAAFSKKARKKEADQVALTTEGHEAIKSELEALKTERPSVVEQIQHAAADKDFRENAPLEAARERQGHIEARIRELEATLKGATVLERKETPSLIVSVGCTVLLCDLSSSEKLIYRMVSPREANPTLGKLSIASPTGRALLDKEIGNIIEVTAPIGTFKYRIDDIKT
ncbi:MAG TPA: transcription elongation factor GreA [Dehalococcoidia bacterium]|nr:transcription elongation factor GreA [Dehalococcoidia bacterium]